ncbi:MAG: hypothetical protein Q9217_003951 [Psora testacea]
MLERHENSSVNGRDANSTSAARRDIFEELGCSFNLHEREKLASLRRRSITRPEEIVHSSDPEQNQAADCATNILAVDLGVTNPSHGHALTSPIGFYQSYLLLRPHPSLRVLFASPDLQTAGVTQTPIRSLINGSNRVQDHLEEALKVGRKVTAKVQWLGKAGPTGKSCWIHCTPLLGANDIVGVWMVILVNAEYDIVEDEQSTPPLHKSTNQLSSTYNAAAIPWDTNRQIPQALDCSGNSSSERVSANKGPLRRPSPGRGSEIAQTKERAVTNLPSPPSQPMADAYLLGQSGLQGSDRRIGPSDDTTLGGHNDRPPSQSSSILPVRTQLQPKIVFHGRTSVDSDSSKKSPINLPGSHSEEEAGADRPPFRKTYKSLSPYGVLFQE